MLLYESHSVIHGRSIPMVGRYCANVFVHFEPNGYTRRHSERVDWVLDRSSEEESTATSSSTTTESNNGKQTNHNNNNNNNSGEVLYNMARKAAAANMINKTNTNDKTATTTTTTEQKNNNNNNNNNGNQPSVFDTLTTVQSCRHCPPWYLPSYVKKNGLEKRRWMQTERYPDEQTLVSFLYCFLYCLCFSSFFIGAFFFN